MSGKLQHVHGTTCRNFEMASHCFCNYGKIRWHGGHKNLFLYSSRALSLIVCYFYCFQENAHFSICEALIQAIEQVKKGNFPTKYVKIQYLSSKQIDNKILCITMSVERNVIWNKIYKFIRLTSLTNALFYHQSTGLLMKNMVTKRWT
jgi:hypothetical protein